VDVVGGCCRRGLRAARRSTRYGRSRARGKLGRGQKVCSPQHSFVVPNVKIQPTTGTTLRVTALFRGPVCLRWRDKDHFPRWQRGTSKCRRRAQGLWTLWVLRFWHDCHGDRFVQDGGCDQLCSYRVTGDVPRCKGYVTSTAGRAAWAGDVAVTAGHVRGRDVAGCVTGGYVTGAGVAGAVGLRLPGSRRGHIPICLQTSVRGVA
jgi:hypothetical protein